ncbi:CCA tRNA nucleotidyltransferase [Hyphomicrobium sp.]|uniref:CCA tRNA nucleotidyltransferase n=1 Tax=Hyphomicrobium sp. TaxID=82 RepID=UPI002BB2EF16|nr:CCA tRNA nucleotidyltransferase [Hyphomicrobium sp.]HRN88501.1 CCA tRNA nucleotidyltransferase [Hyphomicrobium sp.]HRQ27471.1 CCA tRNA nucleotidyltransferase [Hyphomicrobium sp.]
MTSEHGEGTLPSLAGALWLTSPDTRAVLDAIREGGFDARIVGGAVRNALMDAPVKDLDIATTALPDEVVRLAEAAGLRAVPTGVTHGTVTVISGRQPFEVTTLRRDIETFGRHARVTFTTDWAEDAARRDFTINALYCDASGTLHDPLGGYPDLAARRVRFIGSAEDRIREDYLRILRFFRFTAEYADGQPDAAGLDASVALADGLAQLSGERIRAEMLRLLGAPRAVETVSAMAAVGIVDRLTGNRCDVRLFARLAAIETALGLLPDPLLRLAALAGSKPGEARDALAQRLRLSNAEAERLARVGLPDRAFRPETDEREARVYIYRFGADAFRDGVLMAWAASDAPADDPEWRMRFHLAERWTAPELPVRGSDLLARGLAEGPAIGRVVRAFEDWWITHDFPSDKLQLAKALSDLVKANRN